MGRNQRKMWCLNNHFFVIFFFLYLNYFLNYNNIVISKFFLLQNLVITMDYDGINVQKTSTGLQLSLEGEMYRQIAQKWEEGKIRPFFSLLKDFIKALEQIYQE